MRELPLVSTPCIRLRAASWASRQILFEIKNGEAPAQFIGSTSDQDRCMVVVMPLTLTACR
jgi:hypothetical protein